MMMKLKHILLIVLCFTANSLFSQEKLSLTLDEAVDYALEHNLNMTNAELAVQEAEKRIWETTAQGLPQVDATLDYSNFLGAEMEFRFDENMPPMRQRFNSTSNFQVTASQLIFSGSYLVGLQTAKLYKSMAEVQRESSELNIKEAVIQAYFLALMAERSEGIAAQNLVNLNDIFEKTEAMVNAGIADLYDLDQLDVQRSQVEQALKSAERQQEIAYNLLRIQLGIEAEWAIELNEDLESLLASLGPENPETASIAENLDYQLMKSQEEMAEKQLDLQKMSYLPTISAFYSYTEKILKPELDFSPKSILGVQANIPIFSSGMRKSRVDQARIQLETQRNNLTLLEDQLSILEKQQRFELTNAKEQFEIQKKNIEVSKSVYENYKRKYEHGLASSLDLTTANNNYLQAESAYLNAAIQLLDAQTALRKLYNRL